jgi:predicted DNA-binding transcriptional regulator YafY
MALCKTLKVSRRTLFRDLASIRRAGIEVDSDGQHFHADLQKLRKVLGSVI